MIKPIQPKGQVGGNPRIDATTSELAVKLNEVIKAYNALEQQYQQHMATHHSKKT